MSEEKRKLGDYEIIQSIYIGDKEVVFGVDKKDPYPFMVYRVKEFSFVLSQVP